MQIVGTLETKIILYYYLHLKIVTKHFKINKCHFLKNRVALLVVFRECFIHILYMLNNKSGLSTAGFPKVGHDRYSGGHEQ